MTTVRRGDKCIDCQHCQVWSWDYKKATCSLYNERGFYPDRPVPSDCIGKVTKE